MRRSRSSARAIVTLDVASDRPIANLAVRLCDVHPTGESLRVSYGVLNLTHRDGHEKPALLAIGERYRVRIQLNDAGSVFPAGHRVRLALSTAYWPMIWPSPEKATLLIFARHARSAGARAAGHRRAAAPLPGPESAPPEKPTICRVAVTCASSASTALAWNWAAEGKSQYHVEEDDPLSAVAELRRTQTMSRDAWQIRIETQMRLSCTRNAFLLKGSLRAWKARRKSVVANGIAPFLETFFNDCSRGSSLIAGAGSTPVFCSQMPAIGARKDLNLEIQSVVHDPYLPFGD